MGPGYNYEHFDEHVTSADAAADLDAFTARLHAGETAPDGELVVLDGERVRLSDRGRGIVLEFGSFT